MRIRMENMVVSDADKAECSKNVYQLRNSIKQKSEVENDDREIIETAQKYGQPIESEEDTFILPDVDHDPMSEQNSENNIDNYYKTYSMVLRENIKFEDHEVSNNQASDSDVDTDMEIDNKPQRRKMLSPSQCKSFVDDLRQKYPEMKDNQKALVDSLVVIMRNTEPPKPPKDFFMMDDAMFECVKCQAHSDSLPAATRHYQERHGPRYLVCFACGVDFRCKTILYKHERRCHAPDANIVLKARAIFLGRKGRSKRMKKSANQAKHSYPCSECSATYASVSALAAHENLHRGVRPYCCDECPRAFTSWSKLTRHKKRHSGVQYICDHCKKAFKSRSNLVTHLDTHSMPKYACESCPSRYATRQALNHHVRSVHLGLPPPLACVLCPSRYPRMTLLRNHMKNKHGMVLMTQHMLRRAPPSSIELQMQGR